MSSSAQYGTKVAPGRWRGKLTDTVFDSEEAMIHYERQEAVRAQARAQGPNPLERLPLDQVRAMAEAFIHQAAENARQTSIADEADVFLMRHPEFVNSPKNGTAIITALAVMGRKDTATVEDMEEAYLVLRDNNALELDKNVLAQQRQAALQARASQPGEIFDEDAAYEMPMAELERRAKGFL